MFTTLGFLKIYTLGLETNFHYFCNSALFFSLILIVLFHSLQHDVQCHWRVRVRKWRLHQLHPDVWRHGPLQGQVRWKTVLLRWVTLTDVVFIVMFRFQLSCSCSHCFLDSYNSHHLPISSTPQPTVCARKATGAAPTAAVCLTAPGAMGKTTAKTTLMKPSATVSSTFPEQI